MARGGDGSAGEPHPPNRLPADLAVPGAVRLLLRHIWEGPSYGLLLRTASCGWCDGGCWALATTLAGLVPGAELWMIVARDGQPHHGVLRAGRHLVDGDGARGERALRRHYLTYLGRGLRVEPMHPWMRGLDYLPAVRASLLAEHRGWERALAAAGPRGAARWLRTGDRGGDGG